jgi:hypothetical protein
MKSIADQLPPEIARQIHPDRRKNEGREEEPCRIRRVTFPYDASYTLASGSQDGTIKLWELPAVRPVSGLFKATRRDRRSLPRAVTLPASSAP